VDLHKVNIMDEEIVLDRKATLDILIALSELHSRLCDGVTGTGDMKKSDKLAVELPKITKVHDSLERTCNTFQQQS
jgi:hypothetical protein